MERFRRAVGMTLILLISGSVSGAEEKKEPAKKVDFSIHEWGVFTAPRGALWLQQDMLAEWQSFPEFFHGVMPDRKQLYRGPVRKPVIFFHGESSEPINLGIEFAAGRPMIWWPPVEFPAKGIPVEGGEAESRLRYRFSFGDAGLKRKPVAKGHWVEDLRKVVSTPINGHGSWGRRLGRGGESQWTETFIYYDGLMKAPVGPEVERTAEGVVLKTESDHEWNDVLVIDRAADGKAVSMGRLARIGKGAQSSKVLLKAVGEEQLKSLDGQLRDQLVAVGLHEDEATSLLDLWSETLFHQSGLSLSYRISQATYGDWIALSCEPAPKEVVRVGLVLHEHLEPELDEVVGKLIDQLGAENGKLRNAAEKQLREIGGAALDAITAAAKSDDPEQATRARAILKSLKSEKDLLKLMERHAKHLSEGVK